MLEVETGGSRVQGHLGYLKSLRLSWTIWDPAFWEGGALWFKMLKRKCLSHSVPTITICLWILPEVFYAIIYIHTASSSSAILFCTQPCGCMIWWHPVNSWISPPGWMGKWVKFCIAKAPPHPLWRLQYREIIRSDVMEKEDDKQKTKLRIQVHFQGV